MEQLEQDYVTTKNKLNTLQKYSKAHKAKLNDIANKLLNNKDEYEFQHHNLIIKKPSHHTTGKKKTGD